MPLFGFIVAEIVRNHFEMRSLFAELLPLNIGVAANPHLIYVSVKEMTVTTALLRPRHHVLVVLLVAVFGGDAKVEGAAS